MEPQVSVIIPAFNIQKYVVNLVRQLERQTFRQCEYLIVDDGSSDATLTLLMNEKRNSSLGEQIHIFTTQHCGTSHARNIAIEQARGEYLIFLDGDDFFKSDLVETYFSKIKESNSDIAFFPFDMVDDTIQRNRIEYQTNYQRLASVDAYTSNQLLDYIAKGLIGGYPVAYISKKKAWDNVRFPIEFMLHEDLYALVELVSSNQSMTIRIYNDVKYQYVMHAESAIHAAGWRDFDDYVAVKNQIIDKFPSKLAQKNIRESIFDDYLNWCAMEMTNERMKSHFEYLIHHLADVRLSLKSIIKTGVNILRLKIRIVFL